MGWNLLFLLICSMLLICTFSCVFCYFCCKHLENQRIRKDKMAEDKIRVSMNIDIREGDDDDKELNITMLNASSNTIDSTNDNLTSPMDDNDDNDDQYVQQSLFSPKQQNIHDQMPQISPMQHLSSPNYRSTQPNIAKIKSTSKSKSRSDHQRNKNANKHVTEMEMTNFIESSIDVNVHDSVSGMITSDDEDDDDAHYRKTKKKYGKVAHDFNQQQDDDDDNDEYVQQQQKSAYRQVIPVRNAKHSHHESEDTDTTSGESSEESTSDDEGTSDEDSSSSDDVSDGSGDGGNADTTTGEFMENFGKNNFEDPFEQKHEKNLNVNDVKRKSKSKKSPRSKSRKSPKKSPKKAIIFHDDADEKDDDLSIDIAETQKLKTKIVQKSVDNDNESKSSESTTTDDINDYVDDDELDLNELDEVNEYINPLKPIRYKQKHRHHVADNSNTFGSSFNDYDNDSI